VTEAGARAPQWIERVRGRGLEDDFLQAAAAGDMRSAQRLRPSAVAAPIDAASAPAIKAWTATPRHLGRILPCG
jgi:hypothetical protein